MKITIFGTGNVATHLGKAFFAAGHAISQVWSRNKDRAKGLATLLDAEAIDDRVALDRDADLYVLAVSDDAIAPLAARMPPVRGVVVHCSGATPLAILAGSHDCGVVYPLQSLSKNAVLDIRTVPFAVEGNSAATTSLLLGLMRQLSPTSFICNSQQRLALHVAAVFANNFSNALFQISHEILQENGLSFDLLKPLILETAQKVQTHIPGEVQTGPAKRADGKTIERHLDFLGKNPDREKIYRIMTERIGSAYPAPPITAAEKDPSRPGFFGR